jgi:hypothetical protein
MTANMGTADRLIRFAIAAVLAILYFTGTITGTLAIVALVVAVVFALTSLVSFCPLYTLLGVRTCPARKA